jgi:hypothetical protein
MDLQAIAIVFESCTQVTPLGGRLATIGRPGWIKAAGAFLGPPREVRSRHNILQWI